MFGMGTGGSLRLLSPETKLSLDSIAAAFLASSVRPSYGLPTAFRHFGVRNRFRTLKTAQGRASLAPDQGALSALSKLRFRLPGFRFQTSSFQDQALDRLVSSSSIRYRTSTDDLSTLSSSRGLTCLRSGNSLLWGGFTLRCLQRLSRPHFASQLCHWHDNCCTRGASIPVLSY